MSTYIKQRIEEGEHQQQDFKFAITDSKKIARTLSAFANTDGGRLLVGVKDNGEIAGIRSEEEYHMIESAAAIHCKPKIHFTTTEHEVEGKTILEIYVPRSPQKPHTAPSKEGVDLIYIREKDKNYPANTVLLKVWQKLKQKQGIQIIYTDTEKHLLQYLEEHEQITLSGLCKISNVSRYKAEHILANFIVLDLLQIDFTPNATYYRLKRIQKNAPTSPNQENTTNRPLNKNFRRASEE